MRREHSIIGSGNVAVIRQWSTTKLKGLSLHMIVRKVVSHDHHGIIIDYVLVNRKYLAILLRSIKESVRFGKTERAFSVMISVAMVTLRDKCLPGY